jgi:hypothetical protein
VDLAAVMAGRVSCASLTPPRAVHWFQYLMLDLARFCCNAVMRGCRERIRSQPLYHWAPQHTQHTWLEMSSSPARSVVHPSLLVCCNGERGSGGAAGRPLCHRLLT